MKKPDTTTNWMDKALSLGILALIAFGILNYCLGHYKLSALYFGLPCLLLAFVTLGKLLKKS